jgi:hypothetical protein
MVKKKCPGCSESFEEGASFGVHTSKCKCLSLVGQKRMKERQKNNNNNNSLKLLKLDDQQEEDLSEARQSIRDENYLCESDENFPNISIV